MRVIRVRDAAETGYVDKGKTRAPARPIVRESAVAMECAIPERIAERARGTVEPARGLAV